MRLISTSPRMIKSLGSILSLAALLIFSTACEKKDLNTPQSFMEAEAKRAPMKGSQSIAAIAVNNGFNELVAALTYVDTSEGTNLVDMFANGTDQYTVFAPTDSAFFDLYSALGANGIGDLPSSLVYDVLLYHVTTGRRAANSVVPKNKSRKIQTLLGKSFMVNSTGGIQAIGNTANITAADISASNGIVHVIDAVILPIK